MALKRTFLMGVLMFSLMATGETSGQDMPSTRFDRLPDGAANRPFASPGLFDYDAQVFAPLEFTNGKEKAPNTGFYFTLDKTYTSIPKAAKFNAVTADFESTGSEFIWGSRYELGWFSEEEAGWNISYQDSSGSFFTAGQDILVSNPMLVESTFSTVELNRVFRQALSSGGYFEPYLGVRYQGISDKSLEDTTRNIFEDTDADGTLDVVTLDNRFIQKATNSAFGLQAGGRYNVRRGRWRFTGDGAVATTYSQQRYFVSDITERNDPNNATTIGIIELNSSDQSFVPIIDGQVEMAYNVSRDLSLRFGVQATYMWEGIARVNTETTNLNGNSVFGTGPLVQPFDEDFVATGFIFGVEWRR